MKLNDSIILQKSLDEVVNRMRMNIINQVDCSVRSKLHDQIYLNIEKDVYYLCYIQICLSILQNK
jgi:hypothetical protein